MKEYDAGEAALRGGDVQGARRRFRAAADAFASLRNRFLQARLDQADLDQYVTYLEDLAAGKTSTAGPQPTQ
jgi:hypothetical protein